MKLIDDFDETMKTPTAYSQTAGVESLRAMQLAIVEPISPAGTIQSADKANKKTAIKKVEENDEGQLKIVEEELGDAIQISLPQVSCSNESSPMHEETKGENNQVSKGSILGDEEKPPLVDVNWSMFEKICKIGEGANGTVYKVKALKTTIFSTEQDGRIELSSPELVKKYGS